MAHRHAGPTPDPGQVLTGMTDDSRLVSPGGLFIAKPGTRLDGARFVQGAVGRGAAAIVVSQEGLATAKADLGPLPVPFFVVEDPRAEDARLAALWHGAQPGTMVAVTGTNGKTSVASFVRQIWAALGHRAAAFGTAGIEGASFTMELGMTTPDPTVLHLLLRRLADDGVTHAAMEASSHGLAQHRVDGVRLSAAALTNITRDHMDYHTGHEDYVAAKLRLFTEVLPPDGRIVANCDDPVFARIRDNAGGRQVLSVGRAEEADLRLTGAVFRPTGQEIAFEWKGAAGSARLGLIGSFQAENVLLAAGLAIAAGDAPAAVLAKLPSLTGVRGRMERAAARKNGAAIYVDYAHTPDALATAIAALRPHCSGRLVVVFGAGGDRDPGKRVLMGRAVAGLADQAVVTDDNPRSENPAEIRAAIMAGCPGADEIGDRTAAILAGVDALRDPGDCLLIAGKGHEQGQEVAGRVIPFDDAAQARAAVAALDGIDAAVGR